jgi:hypothetical protein
MDLPTFYQSLQEYFRFTYGLAQAEGDNINLGEKFLLDFMVTNDAPEPVPTMPKVVFHELSLRVEATEFATPLKDDAPVAFIELEFPVSRLSPGESIQVTVEMRALKNLDGLASWLAEEEVAVAHVSGTVDTRELFRIHKTAYVQEDIKS